MDTTVLAGITFLAFALVCLIVFLATRGPKLEEANLWIDSYGQVLLNKKKTTLLFFLHLKERHLYMKPKVIGGKRFKE